MARREQFFHGTRYDIRHTVLPGGRAPHRNWFGEDNPHGKAFATTDEDIAWDYAKGAEGNWDKRRTRVYEVAPSAKREPGTWNKQHPGHSGLDREDMKEWMAPSWKVRRRIDIKPGHQGTFPQLNWNQFASHEGPNKVQQGDVNHPTPRQVESGHGLGSWSPPEREEHHPEVHGQQSMFEHVDRGVRARGLSSWTDEELGRLG